MVLNKKLALFTVLISIPIGGIGIDLYTPAMPAMAEAFHTNPSAVKLTISLFLLGAGLSQLITSPLSDSYGRKYIKLFGLIIFAISNMAIVFSPSIHWVNFFRLIQGMAAGTITSLARAKVTDVFEKHEMRLISSYITISWALGPILAPWVGGYIQHYLGWQYCFYFLALYGFFAFAANCLCIPETMKSKKAFSLFDIVSDYKTVLLDGQYIGILFLMGLSYSVLLVFGIIGPFLIQTVLGYSPIVYGEIALAMGAGYFSGTVLGRFLHGIQEHYLMIASLSIISLFVLVAVGTTIFWPHTLIAFCLPVILICSGIGILFPIFLGKSLSLFPNKTGVVAALTGFGNVVIASLGTFVISFIFVKNTVTGVLIYGAIIAALWLVLSIMPKCMAED